MSVIFYYDILDQMWILSSIKWYFLSCTDIMPIVLTCSVIDGIFCHTQILISYYVNIDIYRIAMLPDAWQPYANKCLPNKYFKLHWMKLIFKHLLNIILFLIQYLFKTFWLFNYLYNIKYLTFNRCLNWVQIELKYGIPKYI
jgi:hypothetical protein